MMRREPFTCHEGVAAPIMSDNIDTDQIIPSREMKSVGRAGLGDGLFAGQRYLSTGSREPNPEFVLNQPAYQNASILLSGVNFGCGSSREHAVWALAEYGIRCIIAESFGEIFHGNCAQNGVAPIALDKEQIERLIDYVEAQPQRHKLRVNMERQSVAALTEPDIAFEFEIKPYQKRLLLGGLDPIGLTMTHEDEIQKFLKQDAEARPWIYE